MMKWNRYIRLLVASSFAVILLISCAPQAATPSPGDIQTALAQTLTAQPSETVPPTTAPTKTPAPSSTPYQTATPTTSPPISGSIQADFLNLRTGPSTFFEIINTFVKDTALTALERTPDNRWVNVEIELEDEPTVEGWMATDFLELNGEVSSLPLAAISEGQIIQGRVEDTEGNPIPGVNVATLLQYDDVDLRTDVVSNDNGDFEVYLPEGLTGTFDIQIVSWLCDSPIADLNCQLSGYIQVIDRVFITLPQEEDILFTYEKTNLIISGIVVDAKDEPVSQMNVRAVRDDGAVSFGRTDAVGDFSMPIAEGTWEIFAVKFDPEYLEGEHVSVEVAQSNPDNVTLNQPK
ncbi:MAG: SH3 domain-containing protein [Anaerolineales bacterium]